MASLESLNGLSQAAGVATGLASAVDSFFNVRGKLQEEAIKKKLANAQSLEAYSKIVPFLGTDAAEPLARNMGLIPGGGLMQDQQPQAQSVDSMSSNAAAPPAPQMDSAKTPQTPEQQYQKAIADSYRRPQGEREGLMAVAKTNWEHAQPDYKAGLDAKAQEPLKEAQTRINTVNEQYTRGVRALKEGGPKSAPIIEDSLAQMMTQSGGKPIPIAEQLAEEPRLLAKYHDWVSQKKKGQMDPELAAALKKKFDLVGGAARDAYLSAGKDAEKRAGGWGYSQPAGWSRIGAVDAMNAQMGPLHGSAPHGGQSPGGLLNDGSANASQKQAPAGPPPGLSRNQFKQWMLKNAPK